MGADDVTEAFFDALNDGELEIAKELLHPDAPVDLDTIDMTVYESYHVRTLMPIWLDPDETREDVVGVPDAVLNDDERTWVGIMFSIYERDYSISGSFELRRSDNAWRLYEEVVGETAALSPDPFPDLYVPGR